MRCPRLAAQRISAAEAAAGPTQPLVGLPPDAPGGLRQEGSSNWSATGLSGTASYGEPDAGFYSGILSGALEEKLPGWKITVGPREANGLPSFLKGRA